VPPSTDESIDILMVTHDRPVFTRLSLDRLLSTCDESMRVWIWHNGEHEETLELVRSYLDHPRVHQFHHSVENTGHRGLWKPIDWLLEGSTGGYLSKVDDDCLVSSDWAAVLRQAHRDVPELGVVGCWRFPPEDFRPDLAAPKIETFAAGHRLLRNCWVEGSGFLMKRECVVGAGLLREAMGFPTYCIHLAAAGWVNGWYYPFVHQEHMDDPRSSYWLPQPQRLAATVTTTPAVAKAGPPQVERVQRIRRRAVGVQEASIDPRHHLNPIRRAARLALRA
jgi:hypothetical protein